MNQRPIVVTILAVLAGIVAVLCVIHALQFLGILPFFIGNTGIHTFSLWYALMWGLMAWIYIWLVQMLWRVDPQAWLFLAMITTLNLVFDFVALLGQSDWQDVSLSFILNGIILIYVMLPTTRAAFGTQQP
jgi:hypothetical protein